jgi:hypothetical protein
LDAGILSQLECDLAVTGVYGDDAGGAMLQQAIGEASGGGSDIEANFSGDVDFPVCECMIQLQAAATYVFQVFAEEANLRVGVYWRAGFFYFLSVDENFCGENEGLGAFARWCEAAFEQEFIQAYFVCGFCHAASHSGVCKVYKHLYCKGLLGICG